MEIRSKLGGIKRYIKIYFMLVRYAAQVDFMYWRNLLIGLLVEFGYQIAYITFFNIILLNTKTIAGWGPNEMLIFMGLDTIGSELVTGVLVVWNMRELPYKIWNGELDRILLRPIQPLFTLTLGRPYFISLLSSLTGVVMVAIGVSRSSIAVSPIWILGSLLFFILGFILVYNIIVIISLLSFFFQDTWTFPRVAERVVYSFSGRPHMIYTGYWRAIFFFIIPIVYIASFPADALISGVNWLYLFIAFILTICFSIITKKIWDKAIRSYSSASS